MKRVFVISNKQLNPPIFFVNIPNLRILIFEWYWLVFCLRYVPPLFFTSWIMIGFARFEDHNINNDVTCSRYINSLCTLIDNENKSCYCIQYTFWRKQYLNEIQAGNENQFTTIYSMWCCI